MTDVTKRRGFVCGVAWQHELGLTDVKIYPTADACKAGAKCSKDCGIVEVEIALARWVVRQDLGVENDA